MALKMGSVWRLLPISVALVSLSSAWAGNQVTFVLGQHVFYSDSYKNIKSDYFGAVRIWSGAAQARWRDINRSKGVFEFSELDKHVETSVALGMDVMYTLGQTPEWASVRPTESGFGGMGAAAEPADLNDWYAYVHGVVNRYKGRITAYEVMNEPRIPEAIKSISPGFFSGSTASLIEMTKVVKYVVNRYDPGSKVVCPAFDGADVGLKRMEYFLQAGGGYYCDVFAFHFYLKNETIDEYVSLVNSVNALKKRYGFNAKPLWNTEMGVVVAQSGVNVTARASTGPLSVIFDEQDAAAFAAKVAVTSGYLGVDRVYWFAHDSSSMGSTYSNKSLGKLNDLGLAYKNVWGWLNGNFVSACSISQESGDCSVSDTAGRILGGIAWGDNFIRARVASGYRELRLLDGRAFAAGALSFSQLAYQTRRFKDPVYFAN